MAVTTFSQEREKKYWHNWYLEETKEKKNWNNEKIHPQFWNARAPDEPLQVWAEWKVRVFFDIRSPPPFHNVDAER